MANETTRAPAAPKYTHRATRCNCHVETCNCDPLEILAPDGTRIAGAYDSRRAKVLLDHLNRPEAAPVPASTGQKDKLRRLMEDYSAARFGDVTGARERLLEHIGEIEEAAYCRGVRNTPVAARELDADAERLTVAKINMAQAGVGERAHGYVNGWNDCVDQFASQCASQYTTENATVANRVCSVSGTAESAPASAAPPKPPQAT